MKADPVWRALRILVPCVAVLTARASPAARRSATELEQDTAEDPCSAEQGVSTDVQQWPGGIIPYVLSETLSGDAKTQLMAAMHRWEKTTCTIFLPWTNQADWALFEPGESCCSMKGRVGNGVQRVSIGPGCQGDNSIDSTLQKLIGIPKQKQRTDHPAIPGVVIGTHNTSQQQTEEGTGGRNQNTCTEVCGGRIELDSQAHSYGAISSPHYPNPYPLNLECVWKLIAPRGYAIWATFHDFDVETEANCDYDSVDIFQLDANGRTLNYSHLCGSKIPEVVSTVDSRSEVIAIRLHSDGSYSGSGFLVSYDLQARTVPEETCDHDNGGCGQICVAHAHGHKKHCACREGYTLEGDGLTCRDIDECAHKRGGCDQRCTNTDGSFQCHCRPGFSLNSDGVTCRECGGWLNATSGSILSPGYPSPYPAYQNCLWTIGVRPKHRLKIAIRGLDITPSEKCTEDFLKLEYGHFPHKRKLCGHYPKISYVLQEEENMYVRFTTRDINTSYSSGFLLSYSQVPIEDLTSVYLDFVVVDGQYVSYRQRLWV